MSIVPKCSQIQAALQPAAATFAAQPGWSVTLQAHLQPKRETVRAQYVSNHWLMVEHDPLSA